MLWRLPLCRRDVTGPPLAGDAAVVVPARDEESTLPRLLASLRAQPARPGALVVVDDHSADATAIVACAAGATVVACEPLPPGWTGKAWACWAGARATMGRVLVFLDADTELDPGGLERVLAEHRLRSGLVSVQPFHRTERPYEALSAFFNMVSMMGIEAFTPRAGRRPPVGAFGPCLVCTRADYLRAGGHQSVAGEVVEDVFLARRFLDAGLPVSCLAGRGSISFRMYPGGLGQLVEGWTKNFAAGAAAARPATVALTSAWLAGCITAAWDLARRRDGGAAGRYLAHVLQLWWMLRRIGTFGWWPAAAYPVPLAFFLAVFTRSVVLTRLRRAVTWKGRTIRV